VTFPPHDFARPTFYRLYEVISTRMELGLLSNAYCSYHISLNSKKKKVQKLKRGTHTEKQHSDVIFLHLSLKEGLQSKIQHSELCIYVYIVCTEQVGVAVTLKMYSGDGLFKFRRIIPIFSDLSWFSSVPRNASF
jgi:hypothetical protein